MGEFYSYFLITITELFVQTDLSMQNVHEHENSIIGQSKRRRCTFSCDFPLFHSFSLITHLNTPAVTSTTLEKKSDYTLFNVIFPNV